ncbi:hypothetical protein BDY19DRAFT_998528 [Irpex rosettiformis]|uniref:Uncharacterized protein n=1 Tax=Irpex rosettiformis TaxID=378272 RepID=A0ACB8TN91_9APHY|nr:hypothetical protein BDY19DRAFT_998528 [Irpex rosettiformis]
MAITGFQLQPSDLERLPVELLDMVVANCAWPEIRAISLLSQTWRRLCICRLFRNVAFLHRGLENTCGRFLEFISRPDCVHIVNSIKTLTLSGTKFPPCHECSGNEYDTDEEGTDYEGDEDEDGVVIGLDINLLAAVVGKLGKLDTLVLLDLWIFVPVGHPIGSGTTEKSLETRRRLQMLTLNNVRTSRSAFRNNLDDILAMFSHVEHLRLRYLPPKGRWGSLGEGRPEEEQEPVLDIASRPSITSLDISTSKPPLAMCFKTVQPNYLSKITALAVNCRTRLDLAWIGNILPEVAGHLKYLSLSLLDLKIVNEDDELDIDPGDMEETLQYPLSCCTQIRFFQLCCGAVFSNDSETRNAEVFIMFMEVIDFLPAETLRHLVVNLDDFVCAPCDQYGHFTWKTQPNFWRSGRVGWTKLRETCRRFKNIVSIELLNDRQGMERWKEEDRAYVLDEMKEFYREGKMEVTFGSYRDWQSIGSCIH